MPPARTGSVEPFKRADGTVYYRARIRLGDGSRERVDVPEKYCRAAAGMSAKEHAELYAQAEQEREDETGELLAKKRERRAQKARENDPLNEETCSKYRERLTKMQRAEGKSAIANAAPSAWNNWIAPEIGTLPIRTPREVLAPRIENIRDALDVQVRDRIKRGKPHGVSGKRAMNVWSVLRTTFKEAVSSRDRTMRVRTDNPTEGIKPPLKSRSPRKTFIYPVEAARLFACEAVPIEWRITYALAFYLYVRPGELRALTIRDVNLVANVVHVTTAYNEEDDELKDATKTPAGVRDVPIDPALLPLLKALKDRRKPSEPLAPLLETHSKDKRAGIFRGHLERAMVKRPGLLEDTATTLRVNFRSCRDSGITWLALAKVPLATIKSRAGHEELSTTLGYIKMAEDIGGNVGTPFPRLPNDLVRATIGPSRLRGPKSAGKMVPAQGFEVRIGLGGKQPDSAQQP